MTTGVLNYPRRPLTERERGIRETIDRIGDTHPPYIYVSPADAGTLQGVINSLTNGGVIWLDAGTYAGDLIFSGAGNVTLMGVGRDATVLTGSILIQTNQIRLDNLWVMGTGKSYGIKIFKSGAGPNRNEFKLVRVGGTTSSADGPSGPGVWLDGGILNVFDHCLIAFNGGHGVYVNTSDAGGVWTTNVNTFRDCTINGNDAYGVVTETGADGVAGMQQNVFIGGNIEDNAHGAAYIGNSYYTRFENVDFESAINLGGTFSGSGSSGFGGWLITGDSSTYILIMNCGFSSTGDTGRVFNIQSCSYCRFDNNRIDGQLARMDVGIFDENCTHCTANGNSLTTRTTASGSDLVSARWIRNAGQNRGWSS